MLIDFLVSSILNVTLIHQRKQPSDQILYISAPDYQPKLIPRTELPKASINYMRLLVVSDTHEVHHKLELPPSDVFIHCGDILITNRRFSTATSIEKLKRFNTWLQSVDAKHRIVIGGNHDEVMEKLGKAEVQSLLTNASYLEHDYFEIDKIRFWGSPYSEGKSKNKAFQSAKVNAMSINKAPKEIDVLITHGYCHHIKDSINHKLHIWGHSHNSYGVTYHESKTGKVALSICAATMDASFDLSHPPIVVDIPRNMKNDWKIKKGESFSLSSQTSKSKLVAKQNSLFGIIYPFDSKVSPM
jgi:hypothetical protein